MAKTTGDTMAEGLQKVIQQIAALTSLPDADMDFLMSTQAGIASYLKSGAQSASGGNLQLPNGPGGGNLNGMQGGMQQPPPGSPGGMGAGPGMMGIQPPNADELNRLLAQGNG